MEVSLSTDGRRRGADIVIDGRLESSVGEEVLLMANC